MSRLSRLERLAAGKALVSVDLFDTLLLHPPVPELARFGAAARVQARVLAEAGRRPPAADALWQARLAVTKPAFDRVEKAGRGEVCLAAVMTDVCRRVDLAKTAAPLLVEGERRYLAGLLRPNTALIARLTRLGLPVVITSDTLFKAPVLAQLIADVAPALSDWRLYGSRDAGATKRHGTLFPLMLKAEGVTAAQVLHLGDHAWSDVRQAEAAGLTALHLPRPLAWRLVHDLGDRLVRRTLRRRGWLSSAPRLRHG